ncbi:AcrR family transcriptional regulator [Microbacterium resistens]|uniref:AcrR family transcriptional regulator n=1 Tax=Microbacterium resistens TaxID=156977 RepID=A0ABU1S7T5_9MICO|nr:TetR/AcrR family transcriptional regulator [Microbacterium resistens]MDR6865656.1 AcrR family transcriptional regulator [Microbacterium resistens]
MARPSGRTAMIEAALRVIEEHGIAALTLDAVAAEAGVTKRGLIYHFPTKHALIGGIHEFLAESADAALRAALGKDPADATEEERTIAYVRTATTPTPRLDLRLIAEAANDPEWMAPWQRIGEIWFPDAEVTEDVDERMLRNLIVRMAADGLWGYELTPGATLAPAIRERVVDRIIALLDAPTP